jgi:hypothetical protein
MLVRCLESIIMKVQKKIQIDERLLNWIEYGVLV